MCHLSLPPTHKFTPLLVQIYTDNQCEFVPARCAMQLNIVVTALEICNRYRSGSATGYAMLLKGCRMEAESPQPRFDESFTAFRMTKDDKTGRGLAADSRNLS